MFISPTVAAILLVFGLGLLPLPIHKTWSWTDLRKRIFKQPCMNAESSIHCHLIYPTRKSVLRRPQRTVRLVYPLPAVIKRQWLLMLLTLRDKPRLPLLMQISAVLLSPKVNHLCYVCAIFEGWEVPCSVYVISGGNWF